MTSNERSSSSAAIALVLRLVVVLSLAVAALAGFTASPAAAAQHERKIAAPRSARLSSSAAFNPSPQHAYRAAQSKSTEVLVLLIALLPAQGHRELLCAAEYASGLSDAGGDPVNGSDPSGEAVFRQCDGYVYADAAACDLRIASALDFPGLSISHIALIISAAGLGGFFGAGVGAIVGSRTGSVLGTIIGAVSGIPIGAAAGAYKAYDIGQPSQQTLYSDLVGAALIVYNDEESETLENYPGWNDFIGKYGWPAFYGTIIEANPQWRAFAFGVVQGQLHDAVLGLIAGWVEAGFDVAVQIANCRPEGYSFLPT
jgi:hypothetical protein